MAVLIRSFGSMPGGSATNCASSTRADRTPSSSRCRRAATCPSSKGIPQHPPTVQSLSSAGHEQRQVTNFTRARLSVGALALVAVATAVLAWRALFAPADAPAQLLPLASYPGPEGPPALSPDGKLVAFAWPGHAAGPTDIYVKAVGSEALRRLTETADWESSPAWSPDGHSIAFVRDGQGAFTMSQLGGAERQVSASGTQVAWAGDSKSVLIRDREADVGPFGIYQVFLDTLERRRLTQAPSVLETGGLKSHRTAGLWRSYAMSARESRTCTSCPCWAANHGGYRTGTQPLPGYRGPPMVEKLFIQSRGQPPVVCGESARTAPHPIVARRLPTSPHPLTTRRSRGRCPANLHALRFKRSHATSTFT